MGSVRRRFWIETGLAFGCGALALVTLVSRDWIEALTGFDPDHGSGRLEWSIVAVLLFLGLAVGFAARGERCRRLAPSMPPLV